MTKIVSVVLQYHIFQCKFLKSQNFKDLCLVQNCNSSPQERKDTAGVGFPNSKNGASSLTYP